jgi:hypothetical protein
MYAYLTEINTSGQSYAKQPSISRMIAGLVRFAWLKMFYLMTRPFPIWGWTWLSYLRIMTKPVKSLVFPHPNSWFITWITTWLSLPNYLQTHHKMAPKKWTGMNELALSQVNLFNVHLLLWNEYRIVVVTKCSVVCKPGDHSRGSQPSGCVLWWFLFYKILSYVFLNMLKYNL